MPRRVELVLSCEHASNAVPARYRELFRNAGDVLASHRGWDPGALELARAVGRLAHLPVHAGKATRLLVDLNRSLHHRFLHSEFTRSLSAEERARIRKHHYLPYRSAVEAAVEGALATGACVLHIAFHSFTPILDGVRRTADFGILYDPAGVLERRFADELAHALRERAPNLRVRRNYPYRGTSDGLVTYLRRRHPSTRYAGIEPELNQSFPLGPTARWHALRVVLAAAVLAASARLGVRGPHSRS